MCNSYVLVLVAEGCVQIRLVGREAIATFPVRTSAGVQVLVPPSQILWCRYCCCWSPWMVAGAAFVCSFVRLTNLSFLYIDETIAWKMTISLIVLLGNSPSNVLHRRNFCLENDDFVNYIAWKFQAMFYHVKIKRGTCIF